MGIFYRMDIEVYFAIIIGVQFAYYSHKMWIILINQ